MSGIVRRAVLGLLVMLALLAALGVWRFSALGGEDSGEGALPQAGRLTITCTIVGLGMRCPTECRQQDEDESVFVCDCVDEYRRPEPEGPMLWQGQRCGVEVRQLLRLSPAQ